MRRDRVIALVSRHLSANLGPYLAALLFVILGVVVGLTAVGVLSPLQKADLLQYLGGFIGSLKAGQAVGPSVMRLALAENLRSILIAFLLGISILGLPGLAVLLLLRGFVVGFTVGFLAQELGAKGYLLIAAGVLPANLILVPAYAVLAVGAFQFAAKLFQSRFKSRPMALDAAFRYALVGVGVGIAVVFAAGLEAYVSPFLLSALWPYFGG